MFLLFFQCLLKRNTTSYGDVIYLHKQTQGFFSSKHLRQYHLTYFSLKGFSGMCSYILGNHSQHLSHFTICLSNNLWSDFAQGIVQSQNIAMEMVLWIHFLWFLSLRGNWENSFSTRQWSKCVLVRIEDWAYLALCLMCYPSTKHTIH